MTWIQIVIVAVVVIVLLFLLGSVKIIREYERGVAFRLGRLRPVLDPGVRLIFPGLEKLVRVDLRIVTLTIPPQEVITKDNVPARVNAVVLFKVVDPTRSVMAVENHAVATSQMAQTTLRSVVGRADLDTLLAHRADLNEDLARTIDAQTEPWGVHVKVVEIKDVEIPEAMQRAMAREAEAERERRAKIVFPLPMDIIGPFLDRLPRREEKAADPVPVATNHNGSKKPSTGQGPAQQDYGTDPELDLSPFPEIHLERPDHV